MVLRSKKENKMADEFDLFAGMTPVQKAQAIRANPHLNLQNPTNLRTAGLANNVNTYGNASPLMFANMLSPSGQFGVANLGEGKNNGYLSMPQAFMSNDTAMAAHYNISNGLDSMKMTKGADEELYQDMSAEGNSLYGADSVASEYMTPIMRQIANAPEGSVAGLGSVNQMQTPVKDDTAGSSGGFGSYLGDAWDGAKNLFGIGTAAPKQTFKDYQAGGGTMAEDKWNDAQFNQGRLDAHGTMNMMSGGLGAANTVLGALSYFDNKALNKKNMQLIDQQIANNQDVMKTRTERAGDIKKYFG